MPTTEKEYNGYLFAQLTILEDLEKAVSTSSAHK